jgi:hypothetical protein
MTFKTAWSLAAVALVMASLAPACSDETSSGAGTPGPSSSGAGGDASSSSSGAGGAGGDGVASFKTVTGFTAPESAYWDATNKVWYVSNMAPPASGDLSEKDGVGWISRLSESGDIMEEKWVDGLDTPAGLRMLDGILYVANITELVAIDVATGMIQKKIPVPDAVFLNDVAAGGGLVFVSDTFGNAIYSLDPKDAPATFSKAPELKGPNGILVDGSQLMVANLVDFDTAATGPLLALDIGSKSVTAFGTLMGKLDGIERDGDTFLVSDNPTAILYRVMPDGTFKVAFDLKKDYSLQSAADIGIDPARRMVAIPDIGGNTVTFLEME